VERGPEQAMKRKNLIAAKSPLSVTQKKDEKGVTRNPYMYIYIYISVVGWVINQNRLGGPSCHFITGSQIVLVIFPQYVSYPFNSQSIYSIIFLGTPWYQIDILVPSH